MNIRDLKAILNASDRHDDEELVVAIDLPTVGAEPSVPVRGVSHGFDWDSGRALVHTEKALVPKEWSGNWNPPWALVEECVREVLGSAGAAPVEGRAWVEVAPGVWQRLYAMYEGSQHAYLVEYLAAKRVVNAFTQHKSARLER